MAVDAEKKDLPVGDTLVGHGIITDELVLNKDGFPLFPQPVLADELDPLNWSFAQKHAILAIVMALYFMFTYITTTTVPSFPVLEEQYAATIEQINWTVAIPALGLSLGPLLWASPADIIGRRPILILGTLMALVATIGAALAPTYSGYMAARFFQGLGVSPASNVGLAVINDVFFEHERGQKLGLWVLAIDMGLLFGPLIGGFVSLAGYQWIQWLTAILLGVILLAELAFLPETLYPRRLMLTERSKEDVGVKRTRKLGFANVKPVPGMSHPKLWDTAVRFVKTWKYVVVPVSVFTYCFGWYWWVLSVVTLVPIAYGEAFPEAHVQGLLYIGLIVGTLLSEVLCSGRLSDYIVIRLAKSSGNQKSAEMRLWLAYPAIILTAIGLIVWGISIDQDYHWMVGQVAFALFGAGIQMGNTAICSYVVDAYPMQSMATMTFYAVMLNMSAFVDPFFIVPWVDSVGFTWTFAGHAIITVFFCIPVLAALHKFGAAMRKWSGAPTWVNPEFEQTQFQAHQAESQTTTELLPLGAALCCKTSPPQTLLPGKTKNNIIGQTLNPHDQNLSCGGSSGGEGALQALRGSTLGVGTDIGGSVRIPAAFNGVFSLKPTPERLSYRQVANTNPGQNTYRSTVGFLSTSIGGLELALRPTLSTKPWIRDPAVVPIPFREDELSLVQERADANGRAREPYLPLKLGVLWTDKTVGPHPPILRGLHTVVNALREAGHKVVDWEPPLQATAKRVHVSFLKADGAHDIHSHLDLSGEPLIPDLQKAFQLRPPLGLLETQDLTLQGLEYEAAYSDYWNSTSNDGQTVDAVIMPVAPHAAVIPGKYYHTAYTEVINLLNYSVAVIPVTKANKGIDVVDPSYQPLNDLDKKNWEAYDPEIYDGAPVGLQLVARKFEEEKILGIAQIVTAALKVHG